MLPSEPWQLAARRRLLRAIANAVRPDRRVLADEWAETHRTLPPDTPYPGPVSLERTPYLYDIHRTMSPGSPWREGWWMKPLQVGGSLTGENLIGTWICEAAGSMLVIFPTLDDAKQWELTRFEPMRAQTPALRRRIRPAEEKGSDNTKLRKKYPGGVMRLLGANRPIKSATIKYVKFEEPDEYPQLEQGSVVGLALGRLANFRNKAKAYGDGTPTFTGRSEIHRNVLRGDQRKWYLHCPDCGHAQPLVWEQLKYDDGDPDGSSARYACSDCGALNGEHAWKARNYAPRPKGMTEPEAKASGRAYWEATTSAGEPHVASWYGLEALAAPEGWRPWPELVVIWRAAQGDVEKLQEFWNNYRGLPFTAQVGAEIGADALAKRAEHYDLMTCPQGGLVVHAGVDTQDNRLAVVIRAFGRGEESWGLHHGEIYGDPSSPETWAKLRELLNAPIRHASGQVMRVDTAAIDAGGHHAEDVYAFCRDAQARGKHWFAVRGAKSYDAPKLGRPKTIEFTWRGQAVAGGAQLRFVGTQSIKNLIDGRLKIAQPGGGCYHFPVGFKPDYYLQLRSERREWRRDTQGRKALWWVKGSERNEAWDCEVYLYAAYLYAMSGRHAETVWSAREKLYGAVRQLELLDDGAPAPVQASAPAAAPRADGAADDEASREEEDLAGRRPPAELLRGFVPPQPGRAHQQPRRGFARRW